MKINLKRRKVLMHLKNVLEQYVIAWEKQHILKQDEMLVATALKK
jgi:hemerythrin